MLYEGKGTIEIIAEFYSKDLKKAWEKSYKKEAYSDEGSFKTHYIDALFSSKYIYLIIADAVIQLDHKGSDRVKMIDLAEKERLTRAFISNDELYVFGGKKDQFQQTCYLIDANTLLPIQKTALKLTEELTYTEMDAIVGENFYFLTAEKHNKSGLKCEVLKSSFDGTTVNKYQINIKQSDENKQSDDYISTNKSLYSQAVAKAPSLYVDQTNTYFYIYSFLSFTSYDNKDGILVAKFKTDGTLIFQKRYFWGEIIGKDVKLKHTLTDFTNYNPGFYVDVNGNIMLEIVESQLKSDPIYIHLNSDGQLISIFTSPLEAVNGQADLLYAWDKRYNDRFNSNFEQCILNYSIAQKANAEWTQKVPELLKMSSKNENTILTSIFTFTDTPVYIEYFCKDELLKFYFVK